MNSTLRSIASIGEGGVLIALINSARREIAYQCITIDNIVDHVSRKYQALRNDFCKNAIQFIETDIEHVELYDQTSLMVNLF